MNELAKKYNVTPSQILLRWNMQKGHVLVTTSRRQERMKEYLAVAAAGHFSITPEEERRVDEEGKKRSHRQYYSGEAW